MSKLAEKFPVSGAPEVDPTKIENYKLVEFKSSQDILGNKLIYDKFYEAYLGIFTLPETQQSKEGFEEWLQENFNPVAARNNGLHENSILVAVDERNDNAIVGFSNFTKRLTGSKRPDDPEVMGQLTYLALTKEYRGLGLDIQIVDQTMKRLQQWGTHHVPEAAKEGRPASSIRAILTAEQDRPEELSYANYHKDSWAAGLTQEARLRTFTRNYGFLSVVDPEGVFDYDQLSYAKDGPPADFLLLRAKLSHPDIKLRMDVLRAHVTDTAIRLLSNGDGDLSKEPVKSDYEKMMATMQGDRELQLVNFTEHLYALEAFNAPARKEWVDDWKRRGEPWDKEGTPIDDKNGKYWDRAANRPVKMGEDLGIPSNEGPEFKPYIEMKHVTLNVEARYKLRPETRESIKAYAASHAFPEALKIISFPGNSAELEYARLIADDDYFSVRARQLPKEFKEFRTKLLASAGPLAAPTVSSERIPDHELMGYLKSLHLDGNRMSDGTILRPLSVIERNEVNWTFKLKQPMSIPGLGDAHAQAALARLIQDDAYYARHKDKLPKAFEAYRTDMRANRSFFKGVEAYDPRPEPARA